jgi:hypothetical protein
MSAYIFLLLRLAIILGLFLFIGWCFWTIWRDLSVQSKTISSPRIIPISISWEANGDKKEATFTSREVILGRDAACDIQLGDNTLSARHARLSVHHNQWWVEDLNSTNGTYLNEEPVIKPLVVSSADQLRCGEVVLILRISGGEKK